MIFLCLRAYSTFRAKVIKITYRSMVRQFLGKRTGKRRRQPSYTKKKKRKKYPLKLIKDKKKTHTANVLTLLSCVSLWQRVDLNPRALYKKRTESSVPSVLFTWQRVDLNPRALNKKRTVSIVPSVLLLAESRFEPTRVI